MRLLLATVTMVALAGTAAAQETPSLERLQEAMDMYVGGVQSAGFMGDPEAQCFSNNQELWLGQLAACGDDACRSEEYLNRLAELDGLQPGASQLSDVPLPADRPQLVAVIAPEDDEAQTPKDFDTMPDIEASGTLVFEVENPNHSGLAVRDAEGGDVHVIVQVMEFGNALSHEVLMSHIDVDPEAKYLVRGGKSDGAGDGVFDFGTSQCRYVYRMP
jgi:hypothetical protein